MNKKLNNIFFCKVFHVAHKYKFLQLNATVPMVNIT